jgi:large subunit ribosomal protein L24
MKDWSKSWKSSSQIRKQRKYRIKAPLHIRGKMVSAHLAKDLREKYKLRAIPLRTGDKVKVMRGEFKGQSAKIESVERRTLKVFLEGIKIAKKDGAERSIQIEPSNLLVISLNLDDKMRLKQKIGLPAKSEKAQAVQAPKPAAPKLAVKPAVVKKEAPVKKEIKAKSEVKKG